MEFDLPKEISSIIKVIGVGGGGSNAVNHMYNQGIKGVDFIVCNTDRQALDISPVPYKIQLGPSLTEGRGAGAIPEIGKNAAIENIEEIREVLGKSTKMVFVTAGMGGGTGTGAAPVIAHVAKELGILTVGIVTVPFNFEGKKRRQQAEEGLEAMRQNVDTLLVINNERLTALNANLTITNAFSQADNVLTTAAKGIAEVISVTGAINVDFNDVNTVMKNSGVAIMGSAAADGEERALTAVQTALNSPLLNDNNIEGANYVLLNITYGDSEVTMQEISTITDYIQDEAGSTADVIWGHGYDPSLGEKLSVTIIATGFKSSPITGFEKAPEKKVVNLDEIVAKEVTQPMTSPNMQNTYQPEPTVQSQLKEEIYVKPVESTPTAQPTQTVQAQEPVKKEVVENLQTDISWDFEPTTVQETKKPDVVIHKLDDDLTAKNELTTPITKVVSSPEQQQQLNEERLQRLNDYTSRLRKSDGISELENEPAYKRRNLSINNSTISSQSTVSRFGIGEDENGTSLRGNNSFLHDNVD
jgi:cell division protein FtsZ